MNLSRQISLIALALFLIGQGESNARIADNPDHSDGQAHPDRPTCGTHHFMQLERREADGEKLSSGDRSLLSQYRGGKRPIMERNVISSDGHFRIHFDMTGRDAPDLTDQNGNGIPDYIDQVDYQLGYTWQQQIEEYGFASPPGDDTGPGEGGLDGRVDVYVVELNGSYYGLAIPDAVLPGNKRTAYIRIDNDYQGYPTSGIEGLSVTIAHEFHHVVQFAGYYYDISQPAIYEATSTWMEYKVYPWIHDYRYYFNSLLSAPHNHPFVANVDDGVAGYAHMHYLESLAQQIDDDIVLDIWDEFGKSGRSFEAIEMALWKRNTGLNLTNSFCTFARWSYYTGPHASTDSSVFPEAELYDTMQPVSSVILQPDEEATLAGSLSPLGFGLWRIRILHDGQFIPDTVDVLVTNGRSNLGKGGGSVAYPEDFQLHVNTLPQSGYTAVHYRNKTLYYRLEAPHQDFCVEMLHEGVAGTVSSVAHSSNFNDLILTIE